MRILTITLLTSAVASVAGAQTDWPIYGHDPGGLQYSPLKAIDTKNLQGLMDAGETIDNACENCHKHYWYPDEKPVS